METITGNGEARIGRPVCSGTSMRSDSFRNIKIIPYSWQVFSIYIYLYPIEPFSVAVDMFEQLLASGNDFSKTGGEYIIADRRDLEKV